MTQHAFLDDHLAAYRTDTTEAASSRWLRPGEDLSLPPAWTAEFAGSRLVEAYRIHFRLPRERHGPRGHGCGMPAYVHDTPTEKFVWDAKRKLYVKTVTRPADVDHMGHVDQTEVPAETIAAPTSAEMAWMDRVLAWPGRFLAHDAELTACTSNWATWEARELDIDEMAERFFYAKAKTFQARRREGLRLIARGLNAAGEGVV